MSIKKNLKKHTLDQKISRTKNKNSFFDLHINLSYLSVRNATAHSTQLSHLSARLATQQVDKLQHAGAKYCKKNAPGKWSDFQLDKKHFSWRRNGCASPEPRSDLVGPRAPYATPTKRAGESTACQRSTIHAQRLFGKTIRPHRRLDEMTAWQNSQLSWKMKIKLNSNKIINCSNVECWLDSVN